MKQLHARRSDFKMAAIVERGIHFQNIFGTKFAAEYLNFHNVNVDVTVRVLTRPLERRNWNVEKHSSVSENRKNLSLVS